MTLTKHGTRTITSRVGLRRVKTLCDCGREDEFLYQHLIKGRVRKCECEKAVVGSLGVRLGVWRNDRKFKCHSCLKWRPLYYESSEQNICGSCHG